jgi:hypothetical protein
MKSKLKTTEREIVGGRPPKFREARRPITVTLPERILRDLESLNRDRAKAIVKCVEAVTGTGNRTVKLVEMVEVSPGKALIVVGPSRSLAQLSWLRMVEIMPARFLLVLPSGIPVDRLEVEIHDLIEDLGPADSDDRALLDELHGLISQQRRRKTISKAELVFVDIPQN